MKKLIFSTNPKHKEVLIYTPKFGIIGKIKFCKELKGLIFEQYKDKFLTVKRMEEVLKFMKERQNLLGDTDGN